MELNAFRIGFWVSRLIYVEFDCEDSTNRWSESELGEYIMGNFLFHTIEPPRWFALRYEIHLRFDASCASGGLEGHSRCTDMICQVKCTNIIRQPSCTALKWLHETCSHVKHLSQLIKMRQLKLQPPLWTYSSVKWQCYFGCLMERSSWVCSLTPQSTSVCITVCSSRSGQRWPDRERGGKRTKKCR